MKLKFIELDQFYEELTVEEKAMTLGGIGIPLSDDDLKIMFNYTAIGGFESELAKTFNTEVRLLALTDTGSDVLQGLFQKSKDNKIDQIELTKDNKGAALAFYQKRADGTSRIDIDRLQGADLTNRWESGNAFHTISHEIFHAYKRIVKNVSNDVDISREIDANLFAAFAEQEVDAMNGTEYYKTGAYAYVDKDPDSASETQKAFQLAWDNIVVYNDFSLANYNKLISNFQESLFNQGRLYDSLTHNTRNNLDNQTDIYRLFNETHLKKTIPGNGGGGRQEDPDSGGVHGSDGAIPDYINNPDSSDYFDPNYIPPPDAPEYDPGSPGMPDPGSDEDESGAMDGRNEDGQTYHNGPGGSTTGFGGTRKP